MINLQCQDYEYECKYVTEGEIDKVVDDYKEHMNDVYMKLNTRGKVYCCLSKENFLNYNYHTDESYVHL